MAGLSRHLSHPLPWRRLRCTTRSRPRSWRRMRAALPRLSTAMRMSFTSTHGLGWRCRPRRRMRCRTPSWSPGQRSRGYASLAACGRGCSPWRATSVIGGCGLASRLRRPGPWTRRCSLPPSPSRRSLALWWPPRWPGWQVHALAAQARAHLESSLRRPPTIGSARQPSLATLLGMLTAPALPSGMRDRIVALAADPSPDAAARRALVAERAAPFGADGFPVQLAKLARPRWRGGPVLAAAAAAAALALLGGGMYYVNYVSASSSSPASVATSAP